MIANPMAVATAIFWNSTTNQYNKNSARKLIEIVVSITMEEQISNWYTPHST